MYVYVSVCTYTVHTYAHVQVNGTSETLTVVLGLVTVRKQKQTTAVFS